MFTLLFDRLHRVLLVRLSEVCSSEDLEGMDSALIRFLSRSDKPDTLRCIYDYHQVEAMAVPRSRIVDRAALPPIIKSTRVLVAYPNAPDDFGLTFRRIQLERFNQGIEVVRQLPEAYALLGIDRPNFQPVQDA